MMPETPRVISNSGGRTSAYLTLREMEKGLGPNDYVIFCNTSKEREETYEFLHRQETELGVPLIWLEYCRFNKWKRVSYETAKRNGEVFEEMLQNRRLFSRLFLPHALARFCTVDLKIKVIEAFMRSQGHGLQTVRNVGKRKAIIKKTGDYEQYENLVGIRHDEPHRWHLQDEETNRMYNVLPLVRGRVTKPMILNFWANQPFDLALPPHQSNCDLCFQKGYLEILADLQREPERGQWWADVEEVAKGTFRKEHRMKDLMHRAKTQTLIPLDVLTKAPSISCFCGD
ncbi:adenine nucleotide alpha hydrolase family protein [Hymenobacter ruber]